jgi:hypothetical protein
LNARTPLGFRRTRTLNLLGVVPSAVVAWHFYMARDAALGLRRAAANVATRTMISPWRVVSASTRSTSGCGLSGSFPCATEWRYGLAAVALLS